MAYTVRDFVFQVYRLISASNPTTPLHGDDQKLAIQVLNQQLSYFASNGLMLTIAKTVTCPINNGDFTIRFTDSTYPATTTFTEIVNLTATSNEFVVADPLIYRVGDSISGTGIPANTVINSIAFSTITMSAAATTTGLSNLTFTQQNTEPGVVFIQQGRLANLDSAWLLLSGVTYPLILESRDEYLAAWKYEPLKGLPRFAIDFPDTNFVDVRLYPAPSQFFQFNARGKFQLDVLDANSDMSSLPQYYIRFFLFSVAKDVAMFTGRADAWTEKLEQLLKEATDVIESASETNLAITGDRESLLNGAWRVRAGI